MTAAINAFDRPRASAAGDAAAEGTSGAAARADHTHDRSADSTATAYPKWETFTLSSSTDTLTLSFVPFPNPLVPADDSLHVWLGSAPLLRGTDYTVTGKSVSLLTAAGALSGDTVTARYFYRSSDALDWDVYAASLAPLWWGRLADVSNGGVLLDSGSGAHNGTWNGVTSHTTTPSLISTSTDLALNMTGAAGEGATVPYGSWMNLANNVSWVFVFQSTDTSARIWAREQSTYVWSIQFDGHIYFLASGSLIATSLASTLNDGATHLGAITYDGTNVRIYVDGVLNKTQAYSTALPTPTNAADVFTIGYGGGLTTSHMYAGKLDELMFFSRVLSGAEIANLQAAR